MKESNCYIWCIFWFVICLIVCFIFSSCAGLKKMNEMKKAKYEIGEHKGAKYCAECHEKIYNQWLKFSRHAIAVKGNTFNEGKKKIKNDFISNLMMGEKFCYTCHGNKSMDEGVNCETCHGTVCSCKLWDKNTCNGNKYIG